VAAVKQPPNLHYPGVATLMSLPKGGGGEGTVAHAAICSPTEFQKHESDWLSAASRGKRRFNY